MPNSLCTTWKMLDLYTRPSRRATRWCALTTSKQLIGETSSVTSRAGQLERYDYEYVRNGAANLFMLLALAQLAPLLVD